MTREEEINKEIEDNPIFGKGEVYEKVDFNSEFDKMSKSYDIAPMDAGFILSYFDHKLLQAELKGIIECRENTLKQVEDKINNQIGISDILPFLEGKRLGNEVYIAEVIQEYLFKIKQSLKEIK